MILKEPEEGENLSNLIFYYNIREMLTEMTDYLKFIEEEETIRDKSIKIKEEYIFKPETSLKLSFITKVKEWFKWRIIKKILNLRGENYLETSRWR